MTVRRRHFGAPRDRIYTGRRLKAEGTLYDSRLLQYLI
jgi:hypothetical protein